MGFKWGKNFLVTRAAQRQNALLEELVNVPQAETFEARLGMW